MQLLADELVIRTDVDDLSVDTVRRRLGEKELRPWQREMWCIASVDAEFVARMEDILDLYAEPYDVSALYERFEPEVARRIASGLEFHFTPKHASFLNMVEIGVLSKQCLDRRIPSIDLLTSEINTWQKGRNTDKAAIDWLFDVEAARRKLGRQYPVPTSRPEESEDFPMDDACSTSEAENKPQTGPAELSLEARTTRPGPARARLWHGLRGKIRDTSAARGGEDV